MNNIDTSRSKFFPKTSTQVRKGNPLNDVKSLKRNDQARTKELNEMSAKDANVSISSAIKDFSRIKRAVDQAPEIDNSEKIAKLKEQIKNGTYRVDYDGLADKILSQEL